MSLKIRNILTAGVAAFAVSATAIAFAPTPAMAFSMGGFGHMGGIGQMGHMGGLGQMGHMGGLGEMGHMNGVGVSSLSRTSGGFGNAGHGLQTERSTPSSMHEASAAKTETAPASKGDRETTSAKTQDTGPKQTQVSDSGKLAQGNDKSTAANTNGKSNVVKDDDKPNSDNVARNDAGGDRLSDDKSADPREAHTRPGDVIIRNDDGKLLDYVRRGHDAVIGGPDNTSVHMWCGDGGELFIVCRDYNNGTSIALAINPVAMPPIRVIPKIIPPKKDSWISLYDPDTNTTTMRFWPAGGGPAVTTVEAGNTLANH